jgi:hypothetical protein
MRGDTEGPQEIIDEKTGQAVQELDNSVRMMASVSKVIGSLFKWQIEIPQGPLYSTI